MKKILLILTMAPLFAAAQPILPRFENDTLYTSSGYKIYRGQILHLASGSSAAGYFSFIKFHPSVGKTNTYSLQNSLILVNKLKSYKYSGADNNSIRISGSVTYENNKKEEIDIVMNFEKVMKIVDGKPAELIVPDEFKNVRTEPKIVEIKQQPSPVEIKKQPELADLKKLLVADEIKKLFDLYKAGALTKEEYEVQKKKLLSNQ